MNFTRNEQVDMLLVFGECQRNSRRAQELYLHRYPNRRQPNNVYFLRLEKKFRSTNEQGNEREFIMSEDIEINVLAYVEMEKNASIRQIAQELGISRESVRKILKKHNYKSYKYQINQHLYEADYERRLNFCNWLINHQSNDENFIRRIIFSDESRFTNLGAFNRQNTRYWARNNQHLFRDGAYQERFGFNVWIGVLGNQLLPPIIFDGRLTGERYLQFLTNEVDGYIDQLPHVIRRSVYFQQDGAPPHNAHVVVDHLNQRFGNQWLGTNGPIRWPARSPDLTPIDFFIWGHLKNKVYAIAPTTREDLEARVRRAINEITRQQLDNMLQNIIERATLCRDRNGQQFEHLL